MKAALLLTLWVALGNPAFAKDIVFENRTASFTNLQGQAYNRVELVRGDQDGLIWREGASGGRICYTNLAPDLLKELGIPTNRVELAKARAEKKALADAKYRAMAFAEPPAKSLAPVSLTNAPSSIPTSPNTTMASGGPAYNPGYQPEQYSTPWLYVPFGDFGPPAPSALSAGSAPSAGTVSTAPSAASVPFVPMQAHAGYAGAAFGASAAPSARSAPSALVPTPPVRRGR